MTTFGIDVSHYQAPGLDLNGDHVMHQGYRFGMAKATEGAGYKDPAFHAYRSEAQKAGMLFAAYHFLTRESAAAQVANFCAQVSDPSIPIMLDLEAYNARLSDAAAFRAEARKRGRHVTMLYLPHWYWGRIGSPNLSGWHVVASSYPSSAFELGSRLYPGDSASGWDSYGHVTPVLWQFASSVRVNGYGGRVDGDAFRGSLKELKAADLFKNYGSDSSGPAPAPTHRKRKPNSRGKAVDAAIKALRAIKFRKGSIRGKRIMAALHSLTRIQKRFYRKGK